MERNYQIREIAGLFYIFVEEETTTGMFWWKKKKMEWVRCAENGQGCWLYIPPMAPFTTMEAAQRIVALFKKQTVIHDCI